MYIQLKPLVCLQRTKLPFWGLDNYKHYQPEPNQSHLPRFVQNWMLWYMLLHGCACTKYESTEDAFRILFQSTTAFLWAPQNTAAPPLSCKGATAQLWIPGFTGRTLFPWWIPARYLTTASFLSLCVFHSPECTSRALSGIYPLPYFVSALPDCHGPTMSFFQIYCRDLRGQLSQTRTAESQVWPWYATPMLLDTVSGQLEKNNNKEKSFWRREKDSHILLLLWLLTQNDSNHNSPGDSIPSYHRCYRIHQSRFSTLLSQITKTFYVCDGTMKTVS